MVLGLPADVCVNLCVVCMIVMAHGFVLMFFIATFLTYYICVKSFRKINLSWEIYSGAWVAPVNYKKGTGLGACG